MRNKLKASIALAALCLIIGLPIALTATAEKKTGIADELPEGIEVKNFDTDGKSLSEIREMIDEYAKNAMEREVVLTIADQKVTFQVSDFGIEIENEDLMDEIEAAIPKGNIIQRYKQAADLKRNPKEFELEFAVDEDKLNTEIQEALAPLIVEAKEPTVRRVNGNFIVEEGQVGLSFDIEKVKEDVLEAVTNPKDDKTIELEVACEETQPTIAPDALSHFDSKPLGEWTTEFDESDANRTHNIELAANAINGHYFMPGEEISTLEMIGEVSAAAGYLPAGTFEEGTVKDGIGGGICQVASTLYNTVLWSELEVTYRNSHSMLVTYVDPAMDAMIYADGGKDFKFVNSTNNPVYIEAFRKGNKLTMRIYGTEERPAGRTISYYYNELERTYMAPYFNTVVDPSLPTGKVDQSLKHEIRFDTHPKVVAELHKVVTENGKSTDILVNTSRYKPGLGLLAHSSDVYYEISIGADNRPFLDMKYYNNNNTTTETPTTPATPSKTDETTQTQTEVSTETQTQAPTESQSQTVGTTTAVTEVETK